MTLAGSQPVEQWMATQGTHSCVAGNPFVNRLQLPRNVEDANLLKPSPAFQAPPALVRQAQFAGQFCWIGVGEKTSFNAFDAVCDVSDIHRDNGKTTRHCFFDHGWRALVKRGQEQGIAGVQPRWHFQIGHARETVHFRWDPEPDCFLYRCFRQPRTFNGIAVAGGE